VRIPRLGIDLYSLRSQGWSAFEFLDYAAQRQVEIVHFSEPRFLGSLEASHLRRLREYARRLGLSIEVGMGSICPASKRFTAADGTPEEQMARMFEVAKLLGSPILRAYVGSWEDRLDGENASSGGPGRTAPIEQRIEETVRVLRVIRGRALDSGIRIAMENHAGDLQAREMKMLIEEAGTDFVGCCLDSGNPVWAIEDPHLTLETLAPYVLTTHVRDSAVWEESEGIAVQWTALGEGTIGFGRWLARFAQLCPGKPLSLEIITSHPPRLHRCFETAFWTAYPSMPAWEFARFVKLAREGKPPAPAPQASGSPGSQDHQLGKAAQERIALENSLAWCRRHLGASGQGRGNAELS